MDQLTNMRTFVAVVDGGSFSAAGRALRVSKSVVAKRVNQLEAGLGVQLLLRSTRRLTLTDPGIAFYEECQAIIASVQDAESRISAMTLEPRGHLRINSHSPFGLLPTARELCQFMHRYPSLSLEVSHNDRSMNPIHDGFDVCIQIADLPGDTIARTQLFKTRRVVVASPEYLEEHGTPEHPTDLVDHQCVFNTDDGLRHEWIFFDGDEKVIVAFKPWVLTNSGPVMRESALSGHCISMLPAFFIADDIRRGKLVPILSDFRVRWPILSAYYADAQRIPLKVKLFVEFLVEMYTPCPAWAREESEHEFFWTDVNSATKPWPDVEMSVDFKSLSPGG